MGGAGLRDRLLEQSARCGNRQQHADAHGAGGFAEHGDVFRIAAECRDVLFHPMQRQNLIGDAFRAIAQPGLAGGIRQIEKPENAQTIIERNDHAVAGCQMPAVVDALAAGADHEGAAMDPHHHRPLESVAARRPHVQVEAVFADGEVPLAPRVALGIRRRLGADR